MLKSIFQGGSKTKKVPDVHGKHTILGAGGEIANELSKNLVQYTTDIRLVSRNPNKVNETDVLYPCDLTDTTKVDGAIAGSSVVYLLVGFEFTTAAWQKHWPPLMRAVIEACKKHRSRLVLFDNYFCYADDEVPHMTEDSLVNPSRSVCQISIFTGNASFQLDEDSKAIRLINQLIE
jgi:nucleoside-diphosphate-sugar epimerase